MRRTLLAAAVAFAATTFAGSALAADPAAVCPQGLHPANTAELFFGEDLASGGQVSFTDWRGFVADQVSPRFPTGLTADVYGRDLNAKGDFQPIRSKALFLVLTGAPGEHDRIEAVRAAYRDRFQADSVLLIEHKACVAL
jgi:Protein of unknown function (DUF3574)